MLLLLVWPSAQALARPTKPLGPLHALPVHYVPPENAVLRAPPPQVQITFNEHVNPDISKIVVVDPSNHEVDSRDSQISADGYTMTVSLPLLPAGTYVVFWRTHSADDGHVAGGSYLFHIARADGTVPPLSGPLPTGNIIGGAGFGTTPGIDGPTLLGAFARGIALLALTLLLGILFWALVVQPRQPELSSAFSADGGRRMRRTAELALGVILAATVVEIAAQALLLDGTLAGIISLPLLKSILLQSRFGRAILVRAALAALGLIVLRLSPRRLDVLDRGNHTIALTAFGLGLAAAFEFSGHGGSAPAWWGPVIDYLHLIANGIWLGGLFTLAVVIVPALRRREGAERRLYLAASIPAFSVPALMAVAFVIVTGPLNATVRMTAVQQLWTTPYGIVLLIKSTLFLTMVTISYHHAFRLRPRLAATIAAATGYASRPGAERRLRLPLIGDLTTRLHAFSAPPTATPNGAVALTSAQVAGMETDAEYVGKTTGHDAGLDHTIMGWMRIEASIGVCVLLCAALLAPLAGTLAPAAPVNSPSYGATGGVQTLTQKADGLTVVLSVNPGRFGTNTFTVKVTNPDGTPASNGTVFLVSSMVEMDMGDNTIDLAPSGSPGTYTGQGELAMAGHWNLRTVIRTREDPNNLHTTTFTVSASY
jgi:putative copper export protein/methionine-rich copper-binding protein CopC